MYFVMSPFFAAGSFQVTMAESIEDTTTLTSAGDPGTDVVDKREKEQVRKLQVM
jgi:hypothetical protein